MADSRVIAKLYATGKMIWVRGWAGGRPSVHLTSRAATYSVARKVEWFLLS